MDVQIVVSKAICSLRVLWLYASSQIKEKIPNTIVSDFYAILLLRDMNFVTIRATYMLHDYFDEPEMSVENENMKITKWFDWNT